MTSKISYSKFLKEDIRHRGWLAALSCILLFLLGTVYTTLRLENMIDENIPDVVKMLRSSFPCMLNGSRPSILSLLIALLAVLCAATGFAYLHAPEKIDFYHSLPLTRPRWFLISYLGGLLIFIIPYLASSCCTILVGAAKGVVVPETLLQSVLAVAGGVLGFLVIYHVTILAMLLTGKLVTGILAALVLFVYPAMIATIIIELIRCFFHTYSSYSRILPEGLFLYSSPVFLYSQILKHTSPVADAFSEHGGYFSFRLQQLFYISDTSNLPVLLAFTVLFLIVTGLLPVLLYQKRSSEAAGNALAFTRTAPFIKVLVTIPVSLLIGLFVYSNGSEKKWTFILSIVSAILLCGIIEFIYHADLKKLLSGKISSLISILAVTGVLCIMQFDLFGYDTWLPEKNSLQSMSIYSDSFYGYFCYPEEYYSSSGSFLLEDESLQVTDFAPLYELAEEGIANLDTSLMPETIYTMDSTEYIAVTMRFTKHSGKVSYRTYAVSKEHLLNTLTDLCENEDYRKALFPIFHVNYDEVTGIQLLDIYEQPELLDLTPEQQEALLDAYKQDVLDIEISDLQNTAPLGELYINTTPSEPDSSGGLSSYIFTQFYLYSGYEHTLALLEEYGYTPRTEIKPEDVTRMVYYEPDYDNSADASGYSTLTSREYTVADPDEIQEILSQLTYYTGGILGGRDLTSRSVEISLKGAGDTSYYPLP